MFCVRENSGREFLNEGKQGGGGGSLQIKGVGGEPGQHRSREYTTWKAREVISI